jgi:hypothetical protein
MTPVEGDPQAPRWNSELAAVRRCVFEALAATGAVPSPARIAARLGVHRADVLARLRALHELHQIVLEPEGDTIRMAHPFSAAPMGFVVRAADDRMWWGGCAWDSFGIVAALGEELEIATRCPSCGRSIVFACSPTRAPPDLVVRIPRPAAQWWDDVVATCTSIRLFCDEDHARAYVADRDLAAGALVEAGRMWQLALPWYGDRLDPGYTPQASAHRQTLLDDLGLDGDFWRLP